MIALVMFVLVCFILLAGFPVALTLGGVALWFALGGVALGALPAVDLLDFSSRLFGTLSNDTLLAVPLFVAMGVVLERARLAEDLLQGLQQLWGRRRGGLGYTVILVGALLAASTGIVGATVVTLGLLCMPVMLRQNCPPSLAAGTIAAAGTLGQIIPPSIVLVLLGDVLSSAYQQAQLRMGVFNAQTVSVGDLFAGALLPGLILVAVYLLYFAWRSRHLPPAPVAAEPANWRQLGPVLVAPMLLILTVLGSILGGVATPTEAASLGAVGALLLAALRGRLTLPMLMDAALTTMQMTAMVFFILIGASLFSLVFNAYEGDAFVQGLLGGLPGGLSTALVAVMLLVFLLGFVLDFIEITFVVVPIVGPALLVLGADPVWLGVLLALNLQTSFLTPPFGFALFYLRGVTPAEVPTQAIWAGAWPFVVIQLLILTLVACWAPLATWLPSLIYGA